MTEIAIIGAGLSGLALTQRLRAEGRDVTLLEARSRPGGRILSEGGYDLGPAWIWPHNRRMRGLVAELGLTTFPQATAGRLVFEDAQGAIAQHAMATMGGALRVAGGLAQITDALAANLGDTLRLSHTVRRLDETPNGVTITGEGFTLQAGRVVLALPPRLAEGFGLSLPDRPTWMAGHAKLVAVYPTPFWRTAGLNGDAISHRGPLAEIHDASPDTGPEGALFAFPHPGAARHPEFLTQALAQLARLFGPDAGQPAHTHLKDWSVDPATATPADATPPRQHPSYRPIPATNRVIFAGTETAATEGGFLEGALEAAEAAHLQLRRRAA